MSREVPSSGSPEEPRLLSDREMALVDRLLALPPPADAHLSAALDKARVRSMDDGGQGSIRFEQPSPIREFGRQLSEFRFTDSDGVPVSATLNVDQFGDLYELDIFKGDFGRLISLPDLRD
ncbi:hypothetical protein ACEXQE_06725 [Herbiconiux sp. P17]|uniref:DUF6984 family protein n=1 Tax=Herbiconiux wuyangfengii TaxID=3342794 RepID=UPI0035B6FEED